MVERKTIELSKKQAEGISIPLKGVDLLVIKTDLGLIGCGAIDIQALENFKVPAAKIRAAHGGPLRTLEELLSGTVKEANPSAEKLGVKPGILGKEALERF